MLPQPQTPSKADDGIEKIKQSLSGKWGIQLPVQDSTWSPSRRDPNRVEDKILACMQFLFFRGGSLDYAIEEFEKRALTLSSDWMFKPRAEPDVLPSRQPSSSVLKQDFLRKRKTLGEDEVRDLTESLWHFLSQIAGRVKAGEKFAKPEKLDALIANPNDLALPKSNKVHRQSSLTSWFRSKSEPSALNMAIVTSAQHPSSDDDFADSEMTDVFHEVEKMDLSPMPHALIATTLNARRASAQTSSSEETFETPPTTPSRCKSNNSGLRIAVAADSDPFYLKHHELVPFTNKKRLFPEPMKPALPRKVSRDARNYTSAYNISHLAPTSEPSDQSKASLPGLTPPPENQKDKTKPNTASSAMKPPANSNLTSTKSNGALFVSAPEDQGFPMRSLNMSRSFDNLSSVSSSMTSASTAWTSPNTSFYADSIATSFNSVAEDTDVAIPTSSDRPQHCLPGQTTFPSWIETSKMISGRQDKIRPPSDSMDIDTDSTLIGPKASIKAAAIIPSTSDTKPQAGLAIEEHIAERLISHSPFAPLPQEYAAVSFRQLYETIRVTTSTNLNLEKFSTCLHSTFETYEDLWSRLSSIAEANDAHIPERSSAAAWNRAGASFEGVALNGQLKLLDRQNGPLFEFCLGPLKMEPSYRLSRAFGSDRFCILGIPGLGSENLPKYLKPYHSTVREAIIRWLIDTEHSFLGRKWRAFYAKPDASKKAAKAFRNSVKDNRYRVYFFAEDGFGFRHGAKQGESDVRRPDHARMTVKDLIDWFMPAKMNQEQPALKFFARLALGVSSTIPAVVFNPQEIFRSDDARADTPSERRLSYRRSDEKKRHANPAESKAPVMNDGCARISRAAAVSIADILGLTDIPCVFQGRIGGAKGIWMIDSLNETPQQQGRNHWIEITDSQLKFEGHSSDAMYPVTARVTFEVNDYSRKLSPSSLNFQLMPILVDRGVPPEVFMRLLDQDLTARTAELQVAMDSGLALRKWNQDNNSTRDERARHGGIEMVGGLPDSRSEKINWFLEHGFEPKTCRYLKDQLFQAIKNYCLRLENKMNIGLSKSTYAFMIADPLAVLEENEIHMSFSGLFRDPNSRFDQTMLHDIDVLVARLPAHLPSDIQKVRAVFKPELRIYRDVIVFPSKGPVSLASKLSGGDYDGDKAWVCWEPSIVEPFVNAAVPESPDLETYGIEKDDTRVSELLPYPYYTQNPEHMSKFLRHAFNFNFQVNMLGSCTIYHEAYCYTERLDDPRAISIAILLGHLVDSAKGGFKFDDAKWAEYKTKNGLRKILPKPAYKDRQKARPTDHLIDRLVFVVAKRVRQEALREFSERFENVGPRDDDLFRIRNDEAEAAKYDKTLSTVLKNLEAGLEAIHTFWRKNARPEQEEGDPRPARKDDILSFRAVVDKCRDDFLKLSPTLGSPAAAESSDTITRWQRDHSRDWDLVKASVAFYHYHRSNFIWYVAGVELGEIKATAMGRGTYRIVTNNIFEAFKLDGKLVDGVKRKELAEGRIAAEEDDDDIFAEWDWDVDDC